MENPKPALSRNTIAFGLSLAVAAIVNGLLVVAKEMGPNQVLPWMKNLTGHHWTTHCILVLAVFVVTGFILTRKNHGKGPAISSGKLIATIVVGTLISIVTIAGFYLIVG